VKGPQKLFRHKAEGAHKPPGVEREQLGNVGKTGRSLSKKKKAKQKLQKTSEIPIRVEGGKNKHSARLGRSSVLKEKRWRAGKKNPRGKKLQKKRISPAEKYA